MRPSDYIRLCPWRFAAVSVLTLCLALVPDPVLAQSRVSAPVDVRKYPALSDKEIGHIRHFLKLSRQLPGDWSGMGDNWWQTPERTLQYQLAFMTYGLATAQYNSTPAYRDVYRETMDRLIEKLLLPDVWRSWSDVSRGGMLTNSDQKALEEGWVDPVRKNNIMYGGHVLHAAALYEVLYREGKYDKPGAIAFRFEEATWGPGPQTYAYDLHSLAKLIHDQFMESHYSGIACEPNLVFAPCNQHAVLGLMLHDYLYGTHYAADVIPNFKREWVAKGYTDPQTKSFMLFRLKAQDKVVYSPKPSIDGWTGTFMHAWDPDYVQSLYQAQKEQHLPRLFGEAEFPESEKLWEARTGLGFFAVLASEVGDKPTLNKTLEYSDRYLSPVWQDGSYYYPRNDELARDKSGIFRTVSPFTGNALLPLARLNRPNGLWKLHNQPWEEKHFKQPYVSGVDYLAIGVSQAFYDAEKDALILTLVPGPAKAETVSFVIRQLDPSKTYDVFRNGNLLGRLRVGQALKLSGIEWHSDGEMTVRTRVLSKTSFIFTGTTPNNAGARRSSVPK